MIDVVGWVGAIPAVLAALAWCLLPGLLVTYTAGVRGIAAWGLAPVVSIGTIAVAAVLGGLLGVPWSPGVGVLPAVALALLVAALRELRARLRDRRGTAPRPPEKPDGRAAVLAAVIGAAGAATLGTITVMLGFGSPGAVSQTYDAVFHYGAVARILDTGQASSLVVGTLVNPDAAAVFYPAAWHDLVALVVLTGGGPIPVATSAVALVVSAAVWPLTCTALVRTVLGPSWAAVGIAPVVAVGFVAFPWSLLSFGVLWPNLLGLSLVPAALAAIAALLGLGAPGSLTAVRAAALLPAMGLGLGLAHPGTVFSAGLLTVPVLAWWWGRRLLRSVRTRRWVSAVAVAVLVPAAVTGVIVFLLTSPLFADVRAFDWPAFAAPDVAWTEVALSSTNDKIPAWPLSVAVLVGLVAALFAPQRRWLVPAHLASAALYVLAASEETEFAAVATGLWYNDSYRLAAMLPITGVPLAVIGLSVVGLAVHRLFARVGSGIPTVATALVLVATSGGLDVGAHAAFVDEAYPQPLTQPAQLLSPTERAFFTEIGPQIDPGAVVAQNPWSGSPLLWPLTDRRVLFPALVGNWSRDQLFLARRLRDAATDPAVCAAATRQGVRYLLVGVPDFWGGDPRADDYPGLDAPAPDTGFVRMAADGRGNELYRLTACAPPGSG